MLHASGSEFVLLSYYFVNISCMSRMKLFILANREYFLKCKAFSPKTVICIGTQGQ